MNRNLKKFICIFTIIGSIIGTCFFIKHSFSSNNDSLININELSKEFMDNYFNEYNNLNKEDKENLLIVISSDKINNKEYGSKKVIEGPNNKYYLLFDNDLDKENAKIKLSDNKSVKSVEDNFTRELLIDKEVSNVTNTYNSWGIEEMGLDYAMESISGVNKKDVTVAIIDTGLDVNLFNKYYPNRLVDGYNTLSKDSSMYDNFGHGTHIAGTIAEGTPNNVKIMPVKVSDGETLMGTDILAALEHVTYYSDVDVLNLSFGSYQYSEAEYQALEAAKENNIIVVAAAGNESTSMLSYPAAFDNTISISSVDSDLNISSFSNFGSTIDFAAPGGAIKSILADYMGITIQNKANGINDNDVDFETISGTSMATPHAVCAVAVLKSLNNNINLDQTKELLKVNALDLGGVGYDIYYGNGFINFKDSKFCTDDKMSCDEFNIYKTYEPTGISGVDVKFTSYNYGSITNILNSEVSFTEKDGLNFTKKIWELDDVEVIGYDPYGKEKQTVTIKYKGFEKTVDVTNPDGYVSGWLYEKANDKYYLTGYKDNGLKIGKLYLPETIEGHVISGIKDSSDNKSILFGNSSDAIYIKEIILPENITYIGSYAFYGLTNCTKIISNGYSKDSDIIVGKYAMADMPSLTIVEGNIIFNEENIAVFENDASLREVTISSRTSTVLPVNTFKGCSSLKSIYFPSPILKIGSSAFESSGLESVTLPDSLLEIGVLAFANTKLNSVILPDTLTTIGNNAFDGANLKSIVIPTNVTSIGTGAFSFNPDLESITVKDGNTKYNDGGKGNVIIETSTKTVIQGSINTNMPVDSKFIGDYAFAGLNIRELTITANVESILENAFLRCDYLEKVVVPKSVTNIDKSNFLGYRADDDIRMLYAPSSGSQTGIGQTVLWVDNNSEPYKYAIENNIPYVLPEPSNAKHITNIMWYEKKSAYNPGDKVEDYMDWIKYYYVDGEETKEGIVNDYSVIYQHGDSLTLDDYYVFIKFSFDKGYQNIILPIYVNVYEKNDDIKLDDINVVRGDYVTSYEYDDGIFTPYQVIDFDEVGTYEVLGDYELKDHSETYNSVTVKVNVLDKELVYSYPQSIASKRYDGKVDVPDKNIFLFSYNQNIKSSDYTIISAKLESPDVSDKTKVTIKVKINDDSYDKYAFSLNKQEIEMVGYTSVFDFDVPVTNLLKNESFYETCIDTGCFSPYGSPSYDTAGDYEVLGIFYYKDSDDKVENILLPVHVIDKEYVADWANIEDKVYDGTKNIDFDTISLDGVDKENYTIISAELVSPEVNDMAYANIKIKLSDEFYQTHAFTGDKQELEFGSGLKVIKATPDYEIPNNLKAIVGQKLSDITLPNGFEWVSEDQELNEVGTKEFIVKYIPEDTNNYNVVENIKVNVEVSLMKYTITFHPNGGKENSYTQELEDNIETKLDKNTFTKEGYDFVGWNTKEDGSGTSYEDEELVGISNDLDLYAQWDESYSYVIDKYTFDDDKKIVVVDVNTKVDDFKNNITLNKNYTLEVDSKKIDNLDVLYTGSKLKIYKNSELYMEYSIVIKGDVSGDGKINYLDYVNIYNHIQKVKHPELDKKELTNEYLEAADMSSDNKVNYLDYVKVYNKIKELKGEN